MKNLLYVAMIFALLQLTSCSSRVYVAGGGGFHSAPPAWAVGHVHQASMRYYYVPSINLYYDSFTGAYYWHNGFRWRRSMRVPPMYANYNFRSAHFTQINFNGTRPYRDNRRHQRLYSRSQNMNQSTPRGNRRIEGQNRRIESRNNRAVRPENNSRSNRRQSVDAPARRQRRVEAPAQRQRNVQAAPNRNSRRSQVNSAPSRSNRGGSQVRSSSRSSRSAGTAPSSGRRSRR
ncbi:hypothetical protein RCC89_12105 [Cytophagaceae bacterium ABcell3]|nr:hypothetical protein RCC89_12105 [Cytophagaceae bacterium ABcell3]